QVADRDRCGHRANTVAGEPCSGGAARNHAARVPSRVLSQRQQAEIARLREVRAPKTRDLSLQADLSRRARDLRRMAKGLGPLAAAWDEIMPSEVASRTSLLSVSRGVLTVRATDTGVLHALSQALRAGAEERLIRRSPVPIRRVRITI